MTSTSDQMIDALKRIDWQGGFDGDHPLVRANGKLIEDAKALVDDGAGYDALRLVAGICSMVSCVDNWDQPYAPMMSFGNERTMLPDDLTSEELLVVRWLAENAENVQLRARASDIAWLRASPRREAIDLARSAVDLWVGVGADEAHWFADGESAIRRAATLAARLRMTDALDRIQALLFDAAGVGRNPVFVGRVLGVLRDFGLARNRSVEVANLLAETAKRSEDGHVTRRLLEDQSRWVFDRESQEASWALIEEIAESWIADAEARTSGPNASQMVAGTFLENALQELRRIPKKYRSDNAVRLIEALPRRIREAGTAGLDEMHAFESDPIDLSDAVHQIRDRVTGLSAVDSLRALSGLSPWAPFAKERDTATELLANSIVGLFGGSTFAGDGRKIHSSRSGETRADGVPDNVWQRMMTHYGFRMSVLVVGQIRPALDVIGAEHRLTRADFAAILRGSGIVPPENIYLSALGLHQGFCGEFAIALHLLVPQIEAIVRYHLREAGVDTSHIDGDSAEMEVGLSTLMDSEAATELYGEDLAFEIRALLCGPLGPNLRNRIAHGLVSGSEAEGEHGEYLWWFFLKFVFAHYFNNLRAGEEAKERPDQTSEHTEAKAPPQDGEASVESS